MRRRGVYFIPDVAGIRFPPRKPLAPRLTAFGSEGWQEKRLVPRTYVWRREERAGGADTHCTGDSIIRATDINLLVRGIWCVCVCVGVSSFQSYTIAHGRA